MDFFILGEGGEGVGEELDDDIGVVVEFEEEEEEDLDVDEVLEVFDVDDDDEGDEGVYDGVVGVRVVEDEYMLNVDYGLNSADIDAYWL